MVKIKPKKLIPPYDFDRSKPFYPHIINYLVTLHGVKELAARGVALMAHDRLSKKIKDSTADEINSIIDKLAEKINHPKRLEIAQKLISSPPIDYMPPLDLKLLSGKGTIPIDSGMIAREIADNFHYVIVHSLRLAAGLLILAWEITKQFHDGSPLWEFLFHCRNAAAHNGRFRIYKNKIIVREGIKQLRRPAEWQKFEIKPSMHGTLLFHTPEEPGLLAPGDPIRLLWDIEQACPHMTVTNWT